MRRATEAQNPVSKTLKLEDCTRPRADRIFNFTPAREFKTRACNAKPGELAETFDKTSPSIEELRVSNWPETPRIEDVFARKSAERATDRQLGFDPSGVEVKLGFEAKTLMRSSLFEARRGTRPWLKPDSL